LDRQRAQQAVGNIAEEVRRQIEGGEVAWPGLGEKGERRARRFPPAAQRVKRRIRDQQDVDCKK